MDKASTEGIRRLKDYLAEQISLAEQIEQQTKEKCERSPTEKHKFYIIRGSGRTNAPLWECSFCDTRVRST